MGTAIEKFDDEAALALFPSLGGDALEALEANMGDGEIGVFNLDRLTVPAGGATNWQVPGLAGEESVAALKGVVLGTIPRRSYWEVPLEESGGAPPDCSSDDNVHGRGLYGVGSDLHPTGECASCPMNQWPEKGAKSRSKPCKEQRLTVFLREGQVLPILIQFAPSSMVAMQQFNMRLTNAQVPHYEAVVSLGLTTADKPVKHSVVSPSLVGRVGKEQGEVFKGLGEQVKESYARITATSTSA